MVSADGTPEACRGRLKWGHTLLAALSPPGPPEPSLLHTLQAGPYRSTLPSPRCLSDLLLRQTSWSLGKEIEALGCLRFNLKPL